MSALEIGRPRRKFSPGPGLVYGILVLVVLAGGYLLVPRFEWHRPQIKIVPDTDTIGVAPLEIAVTEQGRGLKSLTAVLTSGGTEHSLVSEQYDQRVMEKKVTVGLAKITGLKEGPAVLRVTARDRSWWNFFRGNEAVVQKNLTIDVTPPTLELVADDRYVNFGGVGVIVYKPSSDTDAHAYVYRAMPEVGGVVHTHSPYATAWAARAEPIPCVLTAMADEFGGEIPIGPFALIGNDDIGKGIVATLSGHRSPAVLMRSHGVFTIGPTAKAAVKAAVMCEDVARTVHFARAGGEPVVLDQGQIDALYERYQTAYGQR